jgi:DNA polymerase-4
VPQAILLPIDFVRYRTYSLQGGDPVLAPVMEDRGVDEVYIDFTAVPGGQEEGGVRWRRASSRPSMPKPG